MPPPHLEGVMGRFLGGGVHKIWSAHARFHNPSKSSAFSSIVSLQFLARPLPVTVNTLYTSSKTLQ